MTRNRLDIRLSRLLESVLLHGAIMILLPFFFLFALSYKLLHPNRAEECRVIVRDCQSLAGLDRWMDRNKSVRSAAQKSRAEAA